MNPAMKDIEAYAMSRMEEWGLIGKGWSFKWGRSREAMGLCRFSRSRGVREIILSSFLIDGLPVDEQKDTVLHEIAHALDFEQRGDSAHDEQWRWWAVKVGASPMACKEMDTSYFAHVASKSKYMLLCPNGHAVPKHRRPTKRSSCSVCCPNAFNENYLFQVIRNY